MLIRRGHGSIFFAILLLTAMLDVASAVTCDEYAAYPGDVFDGMQSRRLETPHPYCNNFNVTQTFSFSDSLAAQVKLDFNYTFFGSYDHLMISFVTRSGINMTETFSEEVDGNFYVDGTEFELTFVSNDYGMYYGYDILATPLTQDDAVYECGAFSTDPGATFDGLEPRTIESPHSYCNDLLVHQTYNFTESGIVEILISFDNDSVIQVFDDLILSYESAKRGTIQKYYSGQGFEDMVVIGSSFNLEFISDFEGVTYGYAFTATPLTDANSIPTCENFSLNPGAKFDDLSVQNIESPHPYCDYTHGFQEYRFTNETIDYLLIEFKPQSQIQTHDQLTLSFSDSGEYTTKQYPDIAFTSFAIHGSSFNLTFTADDDSYTGYGYKFTVTPGIGEIPLNDCERFEQDHGATFNDMNIHTIQSAHPYCDNEEVHQRYSFTNSTVTHLSIVFDEESEIEILDSLDISFKYNSTTVTRSYPSVWFDDLIVPDRAFNLTFTSEYAGYYGYSFNVTPLTGDFELSDCETFANNLGRTFDGMEIQVIESPHPYCKNVLSHQQYYFTNETIDYLWIDFDSQSLIQSYDKLTLSYFDVSGYQTSKEFPYLDFINFAIPGNSFNVTFNADASFTSYYGYKFTVTPGIGEVPLTDCERFEQDHGATFDDMDTHTIQSAHPYCDNLEVHQRYNFTDSTITHLRIVFAEECNIERFDSLRISYENNNTAVTWIYPWVAFDDLVIPNRAFNLTFSSEFSDHYYGYSFDVTPLTGDFEPPNDCVTFAGNPGETFSGLDNHLIESSHPYCDNMLVNQSYVFTNSSINQIQMVFGSQTDIVGQDSLTISHGGIVKTFRGPDFSNFVIAGREFDLTFRSNYSNSVWGYSIYLIPVEKGSEIFDCDTWQAQDGANFNDTSSHVISSPHPYCNYMTISQHYSFSNETVTEIQIEFDLFSVENWYDSLEITYEVGNRHVTHSLTGSDFGGFIIEGREFDLVFNSDHSNTDYGFDMTVTPLFTGNEPDTRCDSYKANPGATFSGLNAQVIESPHPYCSELDVTQRYSFTDSSVTQLTLSFDSESSIEVGFDMLTISHTKADGTEVGNRYSGDGDFSELVIDTDEFDLKFVTDSIYTMYGYRITVIPGTVTTVTTQSQCKQTMTQEDIDNEMRVLRDYYNKLN